MFPLRDFLTQICLRATTSSSPTTGPAILPPLTRKPPAQTRKISMQGVDNQALTKKAVQSLRVSDFGQHYFTRTSWNLIFWVLWSLSFQKIWYFLFTKVNGCRVICTYSRGSQKWPFLPNYSGPIRVKLSFRHSVERLRIFLSPHLKKKKMNTATKDPPQSELEPRTPRSRILSLSTWAICDSTKAGGKKTLKYGRAHSASRAAVVWRWTWRSCSSLTVVYPLFSLKGRDNSLV